MKKYFAVSFKYFETVYCSNIAHAETAEAVEAHYSKYEWVSVRECEEYEVEEARRRGKPIIEVETPIKEQEEQNEEDNTMTEYKNIKNEVITDSESRKNNTAFYILNGYMPTWAAEHHGDLDRGLQQYSTATRWEQYKNGRITREKAVEFATARAFREIDKKTAAQLAQLDRVAAAPALSYLSISVDWVRSRTWGYNPHAEAMSNAGTFTGTASGCGYDKESAAVAEALNQCDSVLQLLYTYKENALAAGESDESKTASCGRSNGSIIGYGAGYGAIPYFEGGVGVSCFWSILKKCGFEVRGHHGTHSDFYTIEKGLHNMKTPLYKRYADRRPVGLVCLCNTFGVLVFEPMEEDKPDTDFITAWSGSEGQTWGYHRNTVHYTAAGRGYLRKGSLRLYLDEIMRV